MSAGLAEARLNLNKLIEERKEAASELARLQEKHDETEHDTPLGSTAIGGSSKRKFAAAGFDNNGPSAMDTTYTTSSSSADTALVSSPSQPPARLALQQRIERIKEDIECKSVQINEIQTMVIEGDQGAILTVVSRA